LQDSHDIWTKQTQKKIGKTKEGQVKRAFNISIEP